MARKRQEGISTYPRYKLKAYAVAYGIGAGNEKFALEYAEALSQSRAAGVGIYKNAYVEIKSVLGEEKVPSALWGLYKAYINEVVSKVQRRKIADIEDIIEKWEKLGLDRPILEKCAEAIGIEVPREAPVPAQKAA
jgi:1,2-phenylacetyl-CoA epoxidase PaaB subunit